MELFRADSRVDGASGLRFSPCRAGPYVGPPENRCPSPSYVPFLRFSFRMHAQPSVPFSVLGGERQLGQLCEGKGFPCHLLERQTRGSALKPVSVVYTVPLWLTSSREATSWNVDLGHRCRKPCGFTLPSSTPPTGEGGDRGGWGPRVFRRTARPVCVSPPLRAPSAGPGPRSRLLPVGPAGAVQGQRPGSHCVARIVRDSRISLRPFRLGQLHCLHLFSFIPRQRWATFRGSSP